VQPSLDNLTLQLLTWIAARPRTYSETMDAWRTSCPKLTVWEDATAAGLVQIGPRVPGAELAVTLTPRGQALLAVRP
jgi:hypothetical protein